MQWGPDATRWLDVERVLALMLTRRSEDTKCRAVSENREFTKRVLIVLACIVDHPNIETTAIARLTRVYRLKRLGSTENLLRQIEKMGLVASTHAAGFTRGIDGGRTRADLNKTWVVTSLVLLPGYPKHLTELVHGRNLSTERRLGRRFKSRRQLRWATKQRERENAMTAVRRLRGE